MDLAQFARSALGTAFVAVVAVILLQAPRPARAQRVAAEYEVKAAFVYNFAKFVEWPPTQTPDAPLLVCVIGDDPFQGALERVIEHAKVGSRTLALRRVLQVESIAGCQVLFVSESERSRVAEIISHAAAAHVLTISDMSQFVDLGGMIGFERLDSKIRFAVNSDAAARAGLTISSQLLKLAVNAPRQSNAPALEGLVWLESSGRDDALS